MDVCFTLKRQRIEATVQVPPSITDPHAKQAASANAAEVRAREARSRGIGNLTEAEKQDAAGTRNYFGAAAATKLRKQLAASRAASASTGAAAAEQLPSSSSSTPPKTRKQSIWLCFPCLHERASLRCRIDNDMSRHTCVDCGACPQGIYDFNGPRLEVPRIDPMAPTPSAASSESGDALVPASACVFCLRLGVSVSPDSARCMELQREFGCHACDKPDCWRRNPGCRYVKFEQRENHADASTTGVAAANMFERTPVQIRHETSGRIVVVCSGRSFIKGYASGAGCNCLIATMLACLNDNDIPCVANIPWIRERLQTEFPRGENRVTERNFLDLRNHWRSIVNFIGVSARQHGCDPENHIHAQNFNITAILEDTSRVVEKDGDGPVSLFTMNEGNSHFVPLLRNRQGWSSSS